MNRLVFCVFFGLVAIVAAQQYPNQYHNQYPNNPGFQYPNQQFPQQFPQQPNIGDLCKQPGANCKIDSRFAEESSFSDDKGRNTKFTRVCDNTGCYDKKVYSGSSALSVSYVLITACAAFIGAKAYFH